MSLDINRSKMILNIQHNIGPEHWEFAWTKIADEMKNSIVSCVLKTSFNESITLDNVKDICQQLIIEYESTIVALKNHHSPHPESINPDTNLCLSNFLRDIMEINNKTMTIMQQMLDKCKCCEEHTIHNTTDINYCNSYDMSNQCSCLCLCKKMSISLKSALNNEYPLQVKGKLWKKNSY